MIDPIRAAADWLRRTYGERMVVARDRPLADGRHSWLVACRFSDAALRGLTAPQPPLAATIVVPKDGRPPFPAANTAPLDEALNLEPGSVVPGEEDWRWRINARNCLVAATATVHGAAANAIPWRPEDERPDWWSRLLGTHFPDALTTSHVAWGSALDVIADGGLGATAIIWQRRRYRDAEVTGRLLLAESSPDAVQVLDPQRGAPVEMRDAEVQELVVARFARATVEPLIAPWQREAAELDAAVRKANAWLGATYGGEAVLVAPSAGDELRRGWLFACTTRTFSDSGDWRYQMLDAALVVPKDAAEPFGLPHADPWAYLERWDTGADDLPQPPNARDAAWFEPAMKQVGPVRAVRQHTGWPGVLSEVGALPADAGAVVWQRRQDRHGRETVGNLFVARNDNGSPRVVDAREPGSPPRLDASALGLVVAIYQAA